MFVERRKPSPPRWLFWTCLLAGALLIWDMGRFAGALEEKARNRLVAIPSVDLIAVLTGGQGRLKEAFRLLENNQGRFLLISGTSASLDDILAANEIEKVDPILRNRIFLDPRSQRTFDNAKEIRRTIEETQARSVLVVTSNYHMQRSLELIQAELNPDLNVALYPYPVKSPNFDHNTWWQSFDAWRIFLSEYIKSWWAEFQLGS